MSAALVPTALTTQWLGHPIEAHETLGSTNDRAWELDRSGASHGTVVVAATQTAGRGRQGRRWTSANGGLFTSFLLRLGAPREDVSAISLVVGLEVGRTLAQDFGLSGVGLKWPNDVWIDGRKIAGLLLESRVDAALRVVVGLGLNLRAPDEGWGELEGRAVALGDHVEAPTPAQVLECLLPRVESGVDRFLHEGFAPRLPEWSTFDVLSGRFVEYRDEQRVRRARVDGVAADGALRVTHGDGRTGRLFGGEVHLLEVGP